MGILLGALMAAAVAAPPPVHYSYAIKRAEGSLFNPWTLKDDQVELRSYVGSGAKPGDFVAPVIRVAPGQKLIVDLDNQLEKCSAEQVRKHLCFNETNLHTHGLWVSPSGNSDNVLLSIAPGEKFRYEYDIPAEHPAGTFWYHPHRHGSGFVQVGSGMAGALIVTGDRKPTLANPGDIDILLKDAGGRPFPERVMIFQQIQYGCLDEKGVIEGKSDKDGNYIRPFTCAPGKVGRIESPEQDWDWINSGRFTGINGKVQPRLTKARAGQFERWRLIHGGTREPVKMQLRALAADAPGLSQVRGAGQEQWIARYCTGAPLPMWVIAMDGLTRSAVRRAETVALFPGDRYDVLTRFPEAGQYCLIQNATRVERNPQPLRTLAVLEVSGEAGSGDGANALVSTMVSAANRAFSKESDRQVREKVIADLRNGMKLKSFVWHKPIEEAEVSGYREAVLNILETPKDALFHINGRQYDHGRLDMALPLGTAEEWRAVSLLGVHPLHIHVNPFQIVRIEDAKGQDVTDPKSPAFDPDYAGLLGEWKDTIVLKQDLRIAFRTRYERFTGDFVTHCHVMFHGDHGMMLNLSIFDPKAALPSLTEAGPRHETHP